MGCAASTTASPDAFAAATATDSASGRERRDGAVAAKYAPSPEAAASSPAAAASSGLTSSSAARGALFVLSRAAAVSGVGEGVIRALQSVYALWNASRMHPEWIREFLVFLECVEGDLSSSATWAGPTQRQYNARIEGELVRAREVLSPILSATPSVLNAVQLAYAQDQLSQSRARIAAVRAECLLGLTLSSAENVAASRDAIADLLAGKSATATPAAEHPVATAASSSSGLVKHSVLSAAAASVAPSALPSDLQSLFRAFSAVKELFSSASAAKEGAQTWSEEFSSYLSLVESELSRVKALTPPLSSGLVECIGALERAFTAAQSTLAPIVASNRASGGLLSTLKSSSDRSALASVKLSIDRAKAALLFAVLNHVKSSSTALATDVQALETFARNQEANRVAFEALTKEKLLLESLAKTLVPSQRGEEDVLEGRRFLPGTRRGVRERFALFAGDSQSESEGAPTGSAQQQPFMLVLAPPGSGKTTLMSFLASTHSPPSASPSSASASSSAPDSATSSSTQGQVLSAERFRFDLSSRRSVVRSLRSTAYSLALNLPSFRTRLVQSLEDAGLSDLGGGSPKGGEALEHYTVAETWEALLMAPLRALDAELELDRASTDSGQWPTHKRILLLFDAIDESSPGEGVELLKILASIASPAASRWSLPSWVGVVASARPEGFVLRAVRSVAGDERVVVPIDCAPLHRSASSAPSAPTEQDDEQPSDIALFFLRVLRTHTPRDQRERVLRVLLSKAQGMFLYARLALESAGIALDSLNSPDHDTAASSDDSQRFELTLSVAEALPAGMDAFYADTLRRCVGSASLGARSASSQPALLAADTRQVHQVFSLVFAAREPLSLLALAQALGCDWREVVRLSEKARSMLPLFPPSGSSVSSAAASPSNSLRFVHRTARDWLGDPERLDDEGEKAWFVDGPLAEADLVSRAWDCVRIEESEADSSSANGVRFRVEEATIPSIVRSTPNYLSSFLCYCVLHLPAHCLSLLSSSTVPPSALSVASASSACSFEQPFAAAQAQAKSVLLSLLSSVCYIHMRLSSGAVQSLLGADKASNRETTVLVNEYTRAISLVQAEHVTKDADSSLRAFLAFLRGESHRFVPLASPHAPSSPSWATVGGLLGIFEYAASFPRRHPVTVDVGALEASGWMSQWRSLVKTECAQWVQSADPVNVPSTLRFDSPSRPLAPGWVQWADRPDSLSSCVAVVRNTGSVVSLSCATVVAPGGGGVDRTILAVGHSGGAHGVYDLDSLRRLRDTGSGSMVAFDCRPASAKEASSSDDDAHPLSLVAASEFHWEATDYSSSAGRPGGAGGESQGSTINWAAARMHLAQLAKSAPPKGSGAPMRPVVRPLHSNAARGDKFLFAPLSDRVLALCYSGAGVALIANGGSIMPLPERDLGSGTVESAAFSPSGELVAVSVAGQASVLLFHCGPHSGSRPPVLAERLYLQGNVHSTALAFGPDDDAIVRGAGDCTVSLWRRTKRGGDDSEFAAEWSHSSMHLLTENKQSSGGVGAVALSPDHLRILAAIGPNVVLFNALSGACIASFVGHIDRVGAVGFDPSGRVGLSGGGGVDRSVRLWRLDDPQGHRGEQLASGALPKANTSASDAADDSAPAFTLQKRSVRALLFSGANSTLLWNGNAGLHALTDSGSSSAHDAPQELVASHTQALDPAGTVLSASPTMGTAYSGLKASIAVRPLDERLMRVAAVCPANADWIACGATVDDIELWSLSSQALVRRFQRHESDEAVGRSMSVVAHSHTGEVLAVDCVTAIAFTACGRFLLGGGYSSTACIYVWRVADGVPVHLIDFSSSIANDGFLASEALLYDMALLPLPRAPTQDAAERDEYVLAFSVPAGTVQSYRVSFCEDDRDCVTSERRWVQRLPGHSGHEVVRCVQLFQPRRDASDSAQPAAPLLFTGNAIAMVHVLHTLGGEVLYAFSSAPTQVPRGVDRDTVMRLALVEDASSGRVQLFTANSHSGITVWDVSELVRSLASGQALPVPPFREGYRVPPAPLVAEEDVDSATAIHAAQNRALRLAEVLHPPPAVVALVRVHSEPVTSMAVDSRAHRIAVGCEDGSLFVCHWKPSATSSSEAASLSQGKVAHWNGLFDFQPAQRTELSGLVAQLECEP